MKTVRIIFKTHLDIGYTDLAENVRARYLKQYIPNAIKVGRELLGTDTPFVWTVGSWLVSEALAEDDGMVDAAIRDGIIRWHALPFTTHTEIMTEELFEEGLKISRELDLRYNMHTHAAKMTDVPGHTQAMIPKLCKYGIKMLHIGVNAATPKPRVPDSFMWEYGGDRIAVFYHSGGYGGEIELGDNIFIFAHTNDNLGPQSADEIIAIYNEIKKRYPDAYVTVGTLEDIANAVDESSLPTVRDEIGDSWIHGAATDPKKIAEYRATLKYAKENNLAIPRELLLVGEHTCGVCIQKYYPRTEGWYLSEFEETEMDSDRAFLERSWDEQRSYARIAAEKLGFDLQADMECAVPNVKDLEKCEYTSPVSLKWQLFSAEDYRRYKKDYVQIEDEWGEWDFTKKGLYEYDGVILSAKCTASYKSDRGYISELRFSENFEKEHGLPHFFVIEEGDMFEVRMFGKKKSRLPQAIWLAHSALIGNIEVNKLGSWIDPDLALGSPLIMGFDSGVRTGACEFISLDCALIAPRGNHLLEYSFDIKKSNPMFNLYNNIWNTNFPMWWGEDMKFRFFIKKRKDN